MFIVTVFCSILLTNFIYGNPTSDEPQAVDPSADLSVETVDPGSMSKEWPEQHLPRDTDEKQQLFDNILQYQAAQERNEEMQQRVEPALELSEEQNKKQLVGQDYFRVDSKESGMVEQLLAFVESAGTIDKKELKQFKAEVEAGDRTRLTGTNWHHHQADTYPDFGRRFVPQYPYSDVINDQNQDEEDNSLTPKEAPPELVLAVAKESAILAAATPKNPSEELIRKDILRTGQFWNDVWREDVDPKNLLRTMKRNKMQTVNAKLSPGTELYEIVSRLQQMYPKLLYVINKK